MTARKFTRDYLVELIAEHRTVPAAVRATGHYATSLRAAAQRHGLKWDHADQGASRRISRARLEHAARMYSSTTAAAKALGINNGSFARLCRRYGIETPGRGASESGSGKYKAERCLVEGCVNRRWSPREELCCRHMAERNRARRVA